MNSLRLLCVLCGFGRTLSLTAAEHADQQQTKERDARALNEAMRLPSGFAAFLAESLWLSVRVRRSRGWASAA